MSADEDQSTDGGSVESFGDLRDEYNDDDLFTDSTARVVEQPNAPSLPFDVHLMSNDKEVTLRVRVARRESPELNVVLLDVVESTVAKYPVGTTIACKDLSSPVDAVWNATECELAEEFNALKEVLIPEFLPREKFKTDLKALAVYAQTPQDKKAADIKMRFGVYTCGSRSYVPLMSTALARKLNLPEPASRSPKASLKRKKPGADAPPAKDPKPTALKSRESGPKDPKPPAFAQMMPLPSASASGANVPVTEQAPAPDDPKPKAPAPDDPKPKAASGVPSIVSRIFDGESASAVLKEKGILKGRRVTVPIVSPAATADEEGHPGKKRRVDMNGPKKPRTPKKRDPPTVADEAPPPAPVGTALSHTFEIKVQAPTIDGVAAKLATLFGCSNTRPVEHPGATTSVEITTTPDGTECILRSAGSTHTIAREAAAFAACALGITRDP